MKVPRVLDHFNRAVMNMDSHLSLKHEIQKRYLDYDEAIKAWTSESWLTDNNLETFEEETDAVRKKEP